jgi:hypothetical protein
MEQANTKSVAEFFQGYVKLKSIPLDTVDPGAESVDLVFNRKLTSGQKTSLKKEVSNLLEKNFYGSYEVNDIKTTEDEDEEIDKKTGKFEVVKRLFNTLTIKVEQLGEAGSVPTAKQEEGSAFILSQVLRKNKKFTKASDILNDTETKNELEKIFGIHKKSIAEWTHSYFEHQEAFFKKFQPSQWDIFEHGGQDFMSFIKQRMQIVKEITASGQVKDVGKYETWNPSDIWAVKDKNRVKKQIDAAIQEDGTSTLSEMNNVLLKLLSENKLIGLSLKKIETKESAHFVYVNKDPRSVEFANVEDVKMGDISFQIKTEKTVDGMAQGGYVLFGKYTINIIRTPGSGFSNLKFESVVKGSGGRGGAAPVALVADLLKSRNSGTTFVNDNSKYPKTKDEFLKDKKNYEQMYKSLNGIINGSKNYEDFKNKIISMYESKNSKSKGIAQSKLMQIHFFSDALAKNKNDPEFWTDLLYLSLKVGKRFAPHGKLA